MGKNYLWGTESPKVNALLAASGWNLKKRMAIIKESILWPFQYIVKLSINPFKSSLQMAC
jgi:transposase, IS5 family